MRRCRQCRMLFAPRRPLQAVCSPECAIVYAPTAEAERLQRAAVARERREYRRRTESRAAAARKAQVAFNRFVRARDAGLPCISCGAMPEPKRGGTMDCGHYRSTGACPQLRFEPDNAAAQCVRCNRDLSGNSGEFRRGLLTQLGDARLAWIEGPHPLPKWTVADLRAIAKDFAARTREIKKRGGDHESE